VARILISTMAAPGHVYQIMPLAKRLVERGNDVLWHTGTGYEERVGTTGARFVRSRHMPTLDDLFPTQPSRGLAALDWAMRRLIVEPTLGQLADYEAILRDFPADVLVTDNVGMGPMLMREKGGPIWVSMGIHPIGVPDAAAPPMSTGLGPATTWLHRLRNRWMHQVGKRVLMRGVPRAYDDVRVRAGLPRMPRGTSVYDLIISPFLHLYCTVQAFEYPGRRLPAHVRFVGPMLPDGGRRLDPPQWWGDLDGRKVVFVTQGTANTDPRHLVRPLLNGLAGDDVLVVATSPDPEALEPLPGNARVARFLNFNELLPRVDVMVTNGGFSGVQLAMAHGVPLVGAGETEGDKPEVCARIGWTGLGVNLRTGTPSTERLVAAVRKVLGNPSYREVARRLQRECARHDAPDEASRHIEELAARTPALT